MDEAVPTLDDSDRVFLHHPNEPVSEGFSFDPDTADAAADLAGELGADFLEGATRGRDLSDVILSEEGAGETPFLIEDLNEGGGMDLPDEDLEDIEIAHLKDVPRQTSPLPAPHVRKKAAGSR